jgi:hypothetical protein
MKKLLAAALVALLVSHPAQGAAQDVFRSTQSANLPTAAMLSGGNWLFEISHRFDNPIESGIDTFWGFDGGVTYRLGLTFAPHDRLMLGALRSGAQDNVELNAKFRGFTVDSEAFPIEVSAQGGVAWNTEVQVQEGATDNEMQAYVQVLANALVGGRLAVGVVPTFLRNPRLRDLEAESAFVLGLQGQLYTDGAFSFFGEWIVSEERAQQENDTGSFGVEIRTRGHFFKILVTNNSLVNATQVLGGAFAPVSTNNLRFGFNLTRLLPF